MADEKKEAAKPAPKHPNPVVAEAMVTVYSTEKNPHKAPGSIINCTPNMAEHLVARGMATKEKSSKK